MTPSKPPVVRPTRALPFDQLPWDDFERLCLMLLLHEGFEKPQHPGAAGGEQGRDIVAHRDGKLWYVQCKQVKKCGPQVLLDEIEKIHSLIENDPYLRPAGLLFIASCDVSAQARDRANRRCRELRLECEVWGRTDLDAHVQRYPNIVETFFGWYTRPIGIPFQAPSLPAHFIARPEVSDALKARLLADDAAPGALVVSAVHGLGGIGKTTLVAALTCDPAVQARFPDGILWATLGQQPEVLSLLAGWIQALGDYNFHPTVAESASAHLCTLLHDKACLLVVDDAWQADHVRAFLIGGERCRVLVTTRDATLARKVGARLYDLDVMTEPQALALFEARLGPLDGNREQAAALARELGYLPLALELAASQVEGGASWTELLDAFRKGLADLTVLDLDEATYRNESLRLSFCLSLEQLSAEDQEAFAWLGVLPEDARLNPAMAATLWEQPEADAGKRLRRLWNKALLKSVGENCYTVHDLLHDEAKLRLARQMPLQEAHAALLALYRKKISDERWDRLADDGYIHEHLTWHMEQAGQVEAIHALLCLETEEGHNAWYEARERLGQTAGYLADVARAWRLVEYFLPSPEIERERVGAQGQGIGLQCRYALITASLNAIAKNIPPNLLAVLVEKRMWTPQQGLAYACQVVDPVQRADSIIGLAKYLPDSLLHRALVEAETIPREDGRAAALAGLAPYLPEPFVDEVLSAVREIGGEYYRVKALVRLIPYLPTFEQANVLKEALLVGRNIPDPTERVVVLTALASCLPELQQESTWDNALQAVREMQSAVDQAYSFDGLAPFLPEALLGKALQVALDISDGHRRAYALAKLALHLPESLLQEAVAVVQASADRSYKAEALAGLAPYLPSPERESIWQEVLIVIREGDYDWWLETLEKSTFSMPESVLREVLTMAQEIKDRNERAKAVSHLVTGLAPLGYPMEALAEAWQIEDRHWREYALSSLAPWLAKLGYPQQALQAAREIVGREDWRKLALTEMAPHLPVSVLHEALTVANELTGGGFWDARVKALAGLVPYLPKSMLSEALAAAQQIRDTKDQGAALTKMVLHLAQLGSPECAFMLAKRIRDLNWLTVTLSKLTLYLPEPLLRDALVVADEIGSNTIRVCTLAELFPYMSESERQEARQEVLRGAWQDEGSLEWVYPLTRFAPHLTKSEWASICQKAFAEAQGIGDEEERALALTNLPTSLPEPLLREALVVAREIGDVYYQRKALASLIPQLAALGYYAEALEEARDIGDGYRSTEILSGIAPHLPEGMLEEALTVALGMGMDRDRCQAWALAGLAPRLPVSLLQRALAAAMGIEDTTNRTCALAGLIPYLPEPEWEGMWREVLEASIQEEDWQASALARLAPRLAQLPTTTLAPSWQEILPLLSARIRRVLIHDLAALAPVIAKLGGEEAIAETFRAIQDVGRWWP